MNRRMGLAFALILGLGVSLAESATLQKVAVDGDPASDAGSFYRRKFRQPAVSDAAGAHIVASARIFINRTCLVKFDPGPGPDSIVVCRKDISPEGHEFSKFGDPSIDIAGDAAWAAGLTAGRSGVFRGDATVVALTGDPSPAGPGFLKKFSSALITDAGDVVFEATISGGAVVGGVTVDDGYFRCGGGDGNCSAGGTGTIEAPLLGVCRKPFGGAVVTVALQGDPANPVLPPGGTTYGVLLGAPAVENDGIVVFRGVTTGLFVNDVLYLCDPASCPTVPAEAAVKQGDADGNGSFFERFSSPALSDAADIAFQANVNDGLRTSGIYIRRAAGGTIETVARINDVAPGVSPRCS